MAECIILKGGGGADLDVITTTQHDILAGKVGVDKEGNPITGTMPNRGTGYHGVGAGLNTQGLYYYIGPGYYYENPTNNPWVYMSRAEVAATLGIEPWKMRGDVNVCGVQGGIPIQGADVSGTDRAWATNMSNWAGTINLGVRNGHFLNGVNWIQQDIPNYQPWNIKKGVNIGGVVGTWEGYVPTATDLYLRGNNVAGFAVSSSLGVFDAGQITITQSGSTRLLLTASFSIVGYNYLNLEGNTTNSYDSIREFRLFRYDGSDWKLVGSNDAQINPGSYIKSINISAAQISGQFRIQLFQMAGSLYRIWLS